MLLFLHFQQLWLLTFGVKVLSFGQELYFHAENVRATRDDFYTCTKPAKIEHDEIYVHEIVPVADMKRIHHIMVYAHRLAKKRLFSLKKNKKLIEICC